MPKPRSTQKRPLLLSADTVYTAAEFERFEYVGQALTGSTAILRLHLKNGTTIDLPTNDAELQHLMRNLIDAFPAEALAHVKSRPWWSE
jgi:hypothetical protein